MLRTSLLLHFMPRQGGQRHLTRLKSNELQSLTILKAMQEPGMLRIPRQNVRTKHRKVTISHKDKKGKPRVFTLKREDKNTKKVSTGPSDKSMVQIQATTRNVQKQSMVSSNMFVRGKFLSFLRFQIVTHKIKKSWLTYGATNLTTLN